MRSNRIPTIALFVSLVSTTALATPVTYEPAPVSADSGVAAPYDEPGESDTSMLFDLSGAPLLWVSTPIYLRLPVFGAGAFESDGPGLSWVPGGSGSGSGSEGMPPGPDVPPAIVPGDDVPGDDVPGNDVPPGDELPPGDEPPVEAVPEPATLMLMSPAALMLLRRHRQSRT